MAFVHPSTSTAHPVQIPRRNRHKIPTSVVPQIHSVERVEHPATHNCNVHNGHILQSLIRSFVERGLSTARFTTDDRYEIVATCAHCVQNSSRINRLNRTVLQAVNFSWGESQSIVSIIPEEPAIIFEGDLAELMVAAILVTTVTKGLVTYPARPFKKYLTHLIA